MRFSMPHATNRQLNVPSEQRPPYREIPNGLKRSSDGADGQERNVQRGIEQDAVGGGL